MTKWARDIVQWWSAARDVQGLRSDPQDILNGFMASWIGEEMSHRRLILKGLVPDASTSKVGIWEEVGS